MILVTNRQLVELASDVVGGNCVGVPIGIDDVGGGVGVVSHTIILHLVGVIEAVTTLQRTVPHLTAHLTCGP